MPLAFPHFDAAHEPVRPWRSRISTPYTNRRPL